METSSFPETGRSAGFGPLSVNPYAAPRSSVAALEAVRSVALAGRGWRLANSLLDTLFFYILMILLVVALGLAGEIEWLETKHDFLSTLLGWGMFVLYYAVQEGIWGRTLGKWITGTRVLNEDGSVPRFKQILGRSLARLVPFEPLSFFLFGQEPVGWHDYWSNTRVFIIRRRQVMIPIAH
jgi:uncharacterized RDD family membrane protein YckC